MSTPGFILLSRDILDKPSIWRGDSDVLKLWLFILLRCNFGTKSYVYRGVEVKRGQFLRSLRSIAADCSYTVRNKKVEWSPAKVERMLLKLEVDGRIRLIDHGVPNAGTLLEVVNWDQRQSGASFRKEGGAKKPKELSATSLGRSSEEVVTLSTPEKKAGDHSVELWDIWLSELSLKGPHPSLTPKRARVLNALYSEHLSKNGTDPAKAFRGVCQTLKRSSHHMSVRAYQLPCSFLSSPERRESWYLRSLENQPTTQGGGVSLQWSIDDE
jgi:hypothetical protein